MKLQIGVQMYSLRNHIPHAGLEETLREVKNAGFDSIEPICSDYGIGYENVGKAMRKFGLTAQSMHIPADVLKNRSELEKLRDIFGFQTAVLPWLSGEEIANDAALRDTLCAISENTRALGLQFAYHNHAHEFENGYTPVRMCEFCPDVRLQVDVFWVKAAGRTPIEFLQDNAAHIWGVHMKEFGADVNAPEPIVGEGATDAKAVLAFAKAQGHESITLEYEHTDMDEIKYITKSLRFMREQLK